MLTISYSPCPMQALLQSTGVVVVDDVELVVEDVEVGVVAVVVGVVVGVVIVGVVVFGV